MQNLIRSIFILLICESCYATAIQTDLTPFDQVPFGQNLASSIQSLGTKCQEIEVTTLPITLKVVRKSQTQLICRDFGYLGKDRLLKLVYGDDMLDLVEIHDIRNILPELQNRLRTEYGEPSLSLRWVDYFDKAGVSLHVLADKITFVSDRVKGEYSEHIKQAKENTINLALTKKQWQQDLATLDNHIRNQHINPFYHNDEDGYLKLFYRAQKYLTEGKNLNTNIINGYIEELVAYTGDGHSYVSGRATRYGDYPYFVDWFSGGLYITKVEESHKHLLGARVIAFDETGIEKADLLMRPYSPSVNKSSFKRENIYLYRHPGLLHAAGISQKPDEVTLGLELREGRRIKQLFRDTKDANYVALSEANTVKAPLYRQQQAKAHWFKYLAETNTVYVHYGMVVEDEKGDIRRLTQKVMNALDSHKADKLIIDIRDNGGGNSYLNASLIGAITKHQGINQRGKLFVLTNRNTFSAAINFAGNMEIKTKALFVGEKVGDTSTFPGESGPQASFQLPNSQIVVNLSFSEWNATFDYDERDAIGLDIPVYISIEDFISGRDPVLQAALDYEAAKISTANLDQSQRSDWVGRYDFSADKALRIVEQKGKLKMEITELVFSDLYPISDNEMLTDISGLTLKRMPNGKLLLLQYGIQLKELGKLTASQLKPLELLVSGEFTLAKASYKALYLRNPQLLSIRGNSLGILASHLRARYDDAELYEHLRDIAVELHGYPIVSWDVDDIGI